MSHQGDMPDPTADALARATAQRDIALDALVKAQNERDEAVTFRAEVLAAFRAVEGPREGWTLLEHVQGAIDERAELRARVVDLEAERDAIRQRVIDLFDGGFATQRAEAQVAADALRELVGLSDGGTVAGAARHAEIRARERAEAQRAEVERLKAERDSDGYAARVAELEAVIWRDKTGLAHALGEIQRVVQGYAWIRAGEWASYSQEARTAETMRTEAAWALEAVEKLAVDALKASGGLARATLSPAAPPERALELLRTELASAGEALRELQDCGQEAVCARPPGCIRHWGELNRELVGLVQEGQAALQASEDAREQERARAEQLRARVDGLQGLRPAFPPLPPGGSGLPRYGLRWTGPGTPLSVPMDDGYWTPHHLAAGRVAELEGSLVRARGALERLAALYEGEYDPPEGCGSWNRPRWLVDALSQAAQPEQAPGMDTRALDKARADAARLKKELEVVEESRDQAFLYRMDAQRQLAEAEDCGQDGQCSRAGRKAVCIRHWIELHSQRVDERDAALFGECGCGICTRVSEALRVADGEAQR